mmetsp:Transcript_299/g.390  ORF Transcript_299/g.390 Transcript_299/m.390 type:complete len:328 (-) Transcript_299:86-1069(-)
MTSQGLRGKASAFSGSIIKKLDEEKDDAAKHEILYNIAKNEVLYSILKGIYEEVGTDIFESAVDLVKFRCSPDHPRFFDDVEEPLKVEDVPAIPEAEQEAFAAEHLDKTYLKYGSPEALERTGGGVQQVRDLQYKRWDWAKDNLPTYVNMLRVAGHSDEAIQAMLDGRPLCLPDDAMFTEFKESLKGLKAIIEDNTELTNVGFVFTGSSVPGYSQNPMKGKAFKPSKITSASGESDVDLSIKASGVDALMDELATKGVTLRSFPTTCSKRTGGIRHGVKGDLGELISEELGAWWRKWDEKLPGGLQLTFCEEGLKIPPWEARINILD